jgi:hypothetical protein
MTRKLEELFDLPTSNSIVDHLNDNSHLSVEETKTIIATVDTAIDKIDAALAEVSDVDKSDAEMDELAGLATSSYKDLMDLGMNVDSRFAAEIFSTAGTMLGHALTAKTAKMNKKLKMIDLQMKKLKMDRDIQSEDGPSETAQGQVLNRNDLLERLMASRGQNNKSS